MKPKPWNDSDYTQKNRPPKGLKRDTDQEGFIFDDIEGKIWDKNKKFIYFYYECLVEPFMTVEEKTGLVNARLWLEASEEPEEAKRIYESLSLS